MHPTILQWKEFLLVSRNFCSFISIRNTLFQRCLLVFCCFILGRTIILWLCERGININLNLMPTMRPTMHSVHTRVVVEGKPLYWWELHWFISHQSLKESDWDPVFCWANFLFVTTYLITVYFKVRFIIKAYDISTY